MQQQCRHSFRLPAQQATNIMTNLAPEEEEMVFRVLQTSQVLSDGVSARIGSLSLPNRNPIDTPHFISLTSRGTIPHMTPDVINRHSQIRGAYMGLEDFIEKSPKRPTPAIFELSQKDSRPVPAFTATPSNIISILGARRHPAVVSRTGNGQDYVSIITTTGFQNLRPDEYCEAVMRVKPDVAIPLADITFEATAPSAKRRTRRMVERTEKWVDKFLTTLDSSNAAKTSRSHIHVFAPVLALEYTFQKRYLNRLAEDHMGKISGLAIYRSDILADISQNSAFESLPRLSMDSPPSPHQVLRQIQMGIDIFAIPFVNNMSDAGIALTFCWPPPATSASSKLPLGVDMWSEHHKISLKPLMEHCTCYACTKHHQAYLHHLLNAKEMLGWVLLQIHNHHVMDRFFEGIRTTIADATFEKKTEDFTRTYEPELPRGTGERPRARGYNFKPAPKVISKTLAKFDDGEAEDQTLAAEVAGLAVTGQAAGGVETPLVPEADAVVLDREGFAQIEEKK